MTARETELTPTEDLLIEVLAARHRTGETVWTFATTHARTVRILAEKGLVAWKSGVIEKTILVWLTDDGRAYALDEEYTHPASRETTLGALTAADLGRRVRVADGRWEGVPSAVLHDSGSAPATTAIYPMFAPFGPRFFHSTTPVTVYDEEDA